MKNFILIFLAISFSRTLYAQHIFSGKVVNDLTEKPLNGASILSDNKTQTQTDRNGYFEFQTNKNKLSIVVSYVGYKKKVINLSLPQQTMTIIFLEEDSNSLDIVDINTGYQSLPKEQSTGSFEQINNILLNRSVSSDILSRLEGVTNSLLFDKRNNSKTKLQIRGLSTLLADSEPLIVVDNFPYEGDINNINPNDVESVTVLKDAAASSIWGARAGNGVIVITTKKANFNKPLQITLNSSFSFGLKPDLHNLPVMNSLDYIDFQKQLFEYKFYDGDLNANQPFMPLGIVVELLDKQRKLSKDDIVEGSKIDNQIEELKRNDVRNDFEKYIYQTSIAQQYSLNMSEGNDKLKYAFSGGYDDNKADLKGNNNKRISLRFNSSIKPIINLEVQSNISFVTTSITSNSTGGYFSGYNVGSRQIFPYLRLADDNGQPLNIEKNLKQSYLESIQGSKLLDWTYSPLKEASLNDNTIKSQDLKINTAAIYKINPVLDSEIRFQFGSNNSESRSNYSESSFFSRNLVNTYTDGSSGTLIRNVPIGGILDRLSTKSQEYSLRSQLNFENDWNSKNNLTAILGFETRQTNIESNSGRTYGYDDNLLTYHNVDFLNSYPTYDDIFGTQTIDGNISFSSKLNRFVSLYSNASYTYNRVLSISASIRKDASNLFGVETNRRGIPLWSAGLAWNISEQSFFKSDIFSFLKARMTYGFSGNLPNDRSALTIISYFPATRSRVNLPYASVTSPPNPNLRWEKVRMINSGIDFSLKGNRISGSIEYYSKFVQDMLGTEELDPTIGYSSITSNSANMTGRGFDLNIKTINVAGRINWRTNLMFSYVKNKVTKLLSTPIIRSNYYIGNGETISNIVGEMPYVVTSYKWMGLDDTNGNPQGIIENQVSTDYYKIGSLSTHKDLVLHGSPLPLTFGSLQNFISWKSISASFNMIYKFNYYSRRNTINYFSLANYGVTHSDYGSRWQKMGDSKNTTVPSFNYPLDSQRDNFYAYSEATVEKADHIRIRDFEINFNMNESLNKTNVIKELQLYTYVNNINQIIWKSTKTKIDPEYINGLKTPLSISFGFRSSF